MPELWQRIPCYSFFRGHGVECKTSAIVGEYRLGHLDGQQLLLNITLKGHTENCIVNKNVAGTRGDWVAKIPLMNNNLFQFLKLPLLPSSQLPALDASVCITTCTFFNPSSYFLCIVLCFVYYTFIHVYIFTSYWTLYCTFLLYFIVRLCVCHFHH